MAVTELDRLVLSSETRLLGLDLGDLLECMPSGSGLLCA